jgi:hypothetical protein
MAAQNASTPGDKAVQKMDKQVPVVQETVKPAVLFTIIALHPTLLMEMADPEEEGLTDKTALVETGECYDVVKVGNVVKCGEQNVVLGGYGGSRVIRSSAWRRTFPGALPFEPGITIDWTNFMCRVSPNLTVGEVVQWNTEERPVNGSWEEGAIMRMVDLYETIRAAWGGSIGVSLVYPSTIYMYPTNGAGFYEFYNWIRTRWTGELCDGSKAGFIGLSILTGGHFVPGAGRTPSAEWVY